MGKLLASIIFIIVIAYLLIEAVKKIKEMPSHKVLKVAAQISLVGWIALVITMFIVVLF